MSKNDKTNLSIESEPAKEEAPEVAASAVVPTPPPAPEVLDTEALVNGIVVDIPTLARSRPLLVNVAALLSYQRRNDPVDEALADLSVVGITWRSINPAIKTMKEHIETMAKKAVDEFNEKAGEGRQVSLDTLDPSSVFKAEVDVEQKGFREEAISLSGRVQKLMVDLFEEKKQQSVIAMVLGAAARFDESLRRDPEPAPNADLPGWKTPPKIDKSDSRVAKLYQQIALFEKNWARFNDRTKTLAQLKALTFEPERVKAILEAAIALANEQIVQSSAIEGVAAADVAAFTVQAQKIAANRLIVEQAESYLASSKK